MNFLSRLGNAWSALTTKGSGPPGGGYSYQFGGGSSFSDAFKSRRAPTPFELVDLYKSIVYACVNLNANGVARIPLRLYATTQRGQARPKCATRSIGRTYYGRQKALHRLKQLPYTTKSITTETEVDEVTDHPLLDAVTQVNDDLDHAQLITYTVMSLDITGNAYWWPKVGGRGGVPEELWALPPHLVYPMFTSGTMVPDAYTFGGIMYPKKDLVRFRRLSAKNPYGQGYGPEQASVEYARLEDTFVSIQDDMLSNGPRPSVVVSHRDPKGTFGPAERQRFEYDMNAKGRGGRSGRAFVIDGAARVEPISYSPVDLGTKDLSLYDLERIANCFDVPVSMLKTEDVNRANADAGQEQHARNAIDPRCKLIASTLTRWTHSLGNGIKASDGRDSGYRRLFWAFDPAVSEDKKAEADLHKVYVDMGVLVRNEVRLELGYEALEGGDEILVANSMVTLDSIVNGKTDVASTTEEGKPGAATIGDDDTENEIEEDATESEDESEDEESEAKALALDTLREVNARVKAMPVGGSTWGADRAEIDSPQDVALRVRAEAVLTRLEAEA